MWLLFEYHKSFALGHTVRTVARCQPVVIYRSAGWADAVLVWRVVFDTRDVVYLALQNQYLLYVACIAPRYKSCNIPIAILHCAVDAGCCRAIVKIILILQGAMQMFVRMLTLGGEQYGCVEASAQRLDGLAAVVALHIVGVCQCPEHRCYVVERVVLGTVGILAVAVALAIFGATQLAELLQRVVP